LLENLCFYYRYFAGNIWLHAIECSDYSSKKEKFIEKVNEGYLTFNAGIFSNNLSYVAFYHLNGEYSYRFI